MFDEYRNQYFESTHYKPVISQKSAKVDKQGFQYDTYISYADLEPDATWVWENLIPRLKAAGLRIAISGHVPRSYDRQRDDITGVMEMGDAMELARRTLIVLSPNYLSEQGRDFQNLSQIDPQESVYRLLPVKIASLEEFLPPSNPMLFGSVDLTHPRSCKDQFKSILAELELPLPWRK